MSWDGTQTLDPFVHGRLQNMKTSENTFDHNITLRIIHISCFADKSAGISLPKCKRRAFEKIQCGPVSSTTLLPAGSHSYL